MNIAILHYHFDRGGVTRVVSSTLDAFRNQSDMRFGLLSGRPVTEIDAPAEWIPELDYSTPQGKPTDPDELHRSVTARARNLFGGKDPDVWHIHNPALGKNTAFSGLVYRLAKENRALLLHEHDFAEDFRPANFRLRESSRDPADPPFPYGARVRYAVLNQRDAQILNRSGLPEEFLYQLPNPVPVADKLPPPDSNSDLLLYPVRALARKNLGEFLLLSYASGSGLRWESTLPPTNVSYESRFRQWCELTESLKLPVSLGVAARDDRPLEDRLAACRAVVTTSVAEGFGLSFLEPWTFGRPVFGRDLPEITGEFRGLGLRLDSLYDGFRVPASAVDRDEVARRWVAGLESAYLSFDQAPPIRELEKKAMEIRDADQVDFSALGEDLQIEALRKIVREKIPVAPPCAIPEVDGGAIRENRTTILERFSAEAYAHRLRTLYETLVAAPEEATASLDPAEVLRLFLHPSRFHPHFVE